jgi:chemotaxis family two-component system response regulator Rcp1
VEDNPGDVRLMREALRDVTPPVTLAVAQDADEAWSALANAGNTGLPQLVFLDFNLPKGGSRGLLQRMKSDDRLRFVPVAVLTTSDADHDIHDAYQMHANCYLRKPVDLDGFFETIRRAADFWLNVACTVDAPWPESRPG